MINNNYSFIAKNIDNKEFFPIFKFLLSQNNLFLAKKLYQIAKNEGDNSLVSSFSFIYAQYYMKRKQWKKALSHIKGTYNDLSTENANLARLLTVIACRSCIGYKFQAKKIMR